MIYHRFMVGFTSGTTTVYLKQNVNYLSAYAVKVMHKDGIKTIVKETRSLSDALRTMAETVAQFTDGFTTWQQLN